jgi:hypothetical protein
MFLRRRKPFNAPLLLVLIKNNERKFDSFFYPYVPPFLTHLRSHQRVPLTLLL